MKLELTQPQVGLILNILSTPQLDLIVPESKGQINEVLESIFQQLGQHQQPHGLVKEETEYDEHDEHDSTCPYCGGQMTWCDGCRMWSSNCCEEYGTCQCS
jgi:hypothetical protein